MYERNFGSLDSRQLCLRFSAPLTFCEWSGHGWSVRWLSMLDPAKWWRWLRYHERSMFWMRRYPHSSHRCYCHDGLMFDGNVGLWGFGMAWFYSSFWGAIPCHCDKVLEELRQHDEAAGREEG